jgi:hypothetical protein
MPPLTKSKLNRAESARINGAKSKGPKTPEGLQRCGNAAYKHGLYATRVYMLPGESNAEYGELQAEFLAYWQPKGFYDKLLVEQLTGNIWEMIRLQASKNDKVLESVASITKNAPHCQDQAKINLLAEQEVSVAGGTIERMNARLSHLARERQRLEREILTLKKSAVISDRSQMSLIINNRQHPDVPATHDAHPTEGTLSEGPYVTEAGPHLVPDRFPEKTEPAAAPEPENIVEWAQSALDFHPDPVQTQVLTETNKRIMVLAPRQTGKSTAAAVRALYEAVHHDDSTILLASASGRQSGQILQKTRQLARQLDLEFGPPPPKCDGFTLANGATVVALPDSEETIRGFSAPRLIIVDEAAFASPEVFKALEPMLTVSGGTIILLSTPNGQTGYFYDQWHASNSPWARIFGTIEDCPRVDKQAIEDMKRTMAKADFQQEFECKFVAASGQFISLETVRKCLRNDFELFCPDFDTEE